MAVPNVNSRFIGGLVGDLGEIAPVRIGHGCWLGHGAVILRGVTIGNGAVVGAGSVVRGDVPPYMVTTGVPAGEPRPRFDRKLADALESATWWDWPDDVLETRKALFLTSFRDDPDEATRLLGEL